jgi:protein-disulfide isomerase
MPKGFIGIIVGIILVFIAVVAFSGKSESPSSSSVNRQKATQHTKGTGSTKLVEYGDFECQFCYQYEPTIKQVLAKYGDQITFQFRHFPLTSLHPNAFAAARAAEAAHMQGKFWEMHDALYETQNWAVWTRSQSSTTEFNRYAERLGLNVEQFKKDFASTKVNDIVNADLSQGNKLKITGTPTFFLDGKKVDIANSLEAFDKVLQPAIDKAKTSSAN